MDPFLLGYLIVGITLALGYLIERWSWSKALAVLGFLVLLIDTLLSMAKTLLRGHF